MLEIWLIHYISLPAVLTAVFDQGVFEAKGAFFVFIGKKSCFQTASVKSISKQPNDTNNKKAQTIV
ncbi:hypothetical protein PJU73_05870 [Neisseria lisongii]|uniref:Uncharacterized protein n=1 Tax=Neisseria lisongii TaxID=2912188 RepID=A0ABY7RHZ9_9NEIS|nr:hypothetical protein [Neisseria lisongii]WCL70897.1 hypothetical protein PJU73_05870 [Neisseria lisongii]